VIGHVGSVKTREPKSKIAGHAVRRIDVVDARTSSRSEMGWVDDALELRIEVDEDGMARLVQLVPMAGQRASADSHGEKPVSDRLRAVGLPLVDVVLSGSGRGWSGRRYVESVVGGRLRYVDHDDRVDGPWRELQIGLEDPITGLEAQVVYRVLKGRGVLRSRVRLTNGGTAPVTVESVSSRSRGRLG
jgi:alpha-galactosidase